MFQYLGDPSFVSKMNKGLSFSLVRQMKRFDATNIKCTEALVRELQSLSTEQREEAHHFLAKMERNMYVKCGAVATLSSIVAFVGFAKMIGPMAIIMWPVPFLTLLYCVFARMDYTGVQRCFEQVKKD